MTRKTVVIADDSSAYRRRLARAIRRSDHLELLGQFADGPSALRGLLALRPDLAVLDVRMPGMTGIEVCRRLDPRDDPSAPKVVVLSAATDPALSRMAWDAGAVACLDKLLALDEVCRVLHSLTAASKP